MVILLHTAKEKSYLRFIEQYFNTVIEELPIDVLE